MFNVIVDTREQQPWDFTASTSIGEVINKKLDTGDYSIDGLEGVLCIERKKNVAELATNITQDRFKRELERMAQYKYKFLILEFDYYQIDQYPQGSNIPLHIQKTVRVTGNFIMKILSDIQIKYGIHVIPCGNARYAEYVATNIMKRVYESEGGNT